MYSTTVDPASFIIHFSYQLHFMLPTHYFLLDLSYSPFFHHL